MSFWSSDLGQITGKAEDAFMATGSIPDNTTAIARILEFKNDSYNGVNTFKIDWLLIEGQFKGWHVFQKIKAFDADSKKRHTALNMLALIYKMFNIQMPQDKPSDENLKQFQGKTAGIKINEMVADNGKSYNFVTQIHPAEGFVSLTGERKIIAQKTVDNNLDSAFSRNREQQNVTNDDIPF